MFKSKKKIFIFFISLCTVICNEFLADFIAMSRCSWPKLATNNKEANELRAMILADTHLLGPIRGHWLDKLYREWHMRRAFQAAVSMLQPQIVFVLGDLFDEGDFVNHAQFQQYVQRFHSHFQTPADVPIISAVGNHDIGFHYKMQHYLTERFEHYFNNTGVKLYNFQDVNFVLINSMSMKNDGCHYCDKTIAELKQVSNILKANKAQPTFSAPIIMQHFPTYRQSDEECIEHDAAVIESYRANWEVLSKEATALLGRLLSPRLFFAGHSHNYCLSKNLLKVPEYTVASFSWRNKINPSFLLAKFTTKEHAVNKCDMLTQNLVYSVYMLVFCTVALLCIIQVLFKQMQFFFNIKIKHK